MIPQEAAFFGLVASVVVGALTSILFMCGGGKKPSAGPETSTATQSKVASVSGTSTGQPPDANPGTAKSQVDFLPPTDPDASKMSTTKTTTVTKSVALNTMKTKEGKSTKSMKTKEKTDEGDYENIDIPPGT
ncbi:hypothetical protein L596_016230 [Steinernema carpocapsae]|uniref:Uncharacterized protein n=1 Tax=Steinernema carpocapsae TaxID=34508 RepID=A0A4U5NIG4_STECR|nr:hypothetical protein L596_016230 [Steinernema carpocapsae]